MNKTGAVEVVLIFQYFDASNVFMFRVVAAVSPELWVLSSSSASIKLNKQRPPTSPLMRSLEKVLLLDLSLNKTLNFSLRRCEIALR